MPPKKIAIYSGEIPSTTFIERLIHGVAGSDYKIYLFGYQKKKVSYSNSVQLFSFTNKWSKLFSLIRYSILLLVFRSSDKKKLDNIIQSQKGNNTLLKIKYYPVLYHKPAIFHLQWAKSIEDWMWVKQFGIKMVLSLRGAHINYTPISNPEYATVYKKQFPLVDGFHAVSKAIAHETLKYNATPEKIKVVYSGFNLDNLQFKNKVKPTSSPLKIVSVGRSHWKKGYQYALDACCILEQEKFDFQYTIIGVNNDEELLFQRDQFGLEKHVLFKNNLPLQVVFHEIQTADVLLLPSVEEGIANVVLEAMALGTLVISTNCGGMEEVVEDEKNGFIVPVRNPEAIAQKLKKVASLSKEEYQLICNEARNKIAYQHSNQKMIEGMKALYHSVLENKQ